MNGVDRPIFILGPPRSGTSLLYKTLCRHPDVAFVSRAYKKLPEWPRVAEALTRLGLTSSGPKEASRVWNRFQTPGTVAATADEVTPEIRAWYRTFVGSLVRLRRRRRFVAKFPALSLRVPWIDAVFPDALFVVASRDWRAVASSIVVKTAKHARKGEHWIGIPLPELESAGGDLTPAELAARSFRIVHEALERDAARFPERLVHVSYSALCADVDAEMRRITDRLGLSFTDEFRSSLPTGLESRNDKWGATLDAALIERIRQREGELLARFEEQQRL